MYLFKRLAALSAGRFSGKVVAKCTREVGDESITAFKDTCPVAVSQTPSLGFVPVLFFVSI